MWIITQVFKYFLTFLLFLSLVIKIYWKLNVDWESDVAENVFEEDAGKEIGTHPDKFHTLNT